jgi:predicted CoA-binding protein
MFNPDDETIRRILTGTRGVAVVGWSPNPARPSHGVAAFLARRGMDVWRVNPGQAGQVVDGHPVAASLSDLPDDAGIEMVDIFRRPEAVAGIVDEALEHLAGLRVIWMQLGVIDETAAARARSRGIIVVQDRCPKIEAARLGL